MLYVAYEKLPNGDLKLAEDVETHGDLTTREWHVLCALKYTLLHERIVIGCCDGITALLFKWLDGTKRLVENIEKCLELSDPTHWWHVQVKCQGICNPIHVSRADREDANLAYLDSLAYHLDRNNLLVNPPSDSQ